MMWFHFEFCWVDSDDTHPRLFATLFTVFTSLLYSSSSATKTLMNAIGIRRVLIFHNSQFDELWCWIRYACEVRLEAFIINNEQASSCLLHSINPEYSHEFPSLCQEEAEEWEELKSLSKTKIRTHNIPLRFDANKRCLEINAECRAVVASAQQRAIFS